mmetsp:Transcript_22075/g.63684  ORF Transcript_22075/g.63684 Transcript_22075/m.63684 type:complete len:215 (+) Transcript_22075:626-1270(+)
MTSSQSSWLPEWWPPMENSWTSTPRRRAKARATAAVPGVATPSAARSGGLEPTDCMPPTSIVRRPDDASRTVAGSLATTEAGSTVSPSTTRTIVMYSGASPAPRSRLATVRRFSSCFIGEVDVAVRPKIMASAALIISPSGWPELPKSADNRMTRCTLSGRFASSVARPHEDVSMSRPGQMATASQPCSSTCTSSAGSVPSMARSSQRADPSGS